MLRALKQARYDPRNLGHTGLHSTAYCHFTSPIRRYPDLICHRALLSAIGAGEDAPRRSAMPEAGEWTSTRERDAMVIERDADDIARCFLLERELFERGRETEFDGEIVSLIGAGAFIEFGDGYEGMLPVRKLGRGDGGSSTNTACPARHAIGSATQARRPGSSDRRARRSPPRACRPRPRIGMTPVHFPALVNRRSFLHSAGASAFVCALGGGGPETRAHSPRPTRPRRALKNPPPSRPTPSTR